MLFAVFSLTAVASGSDYYKTRTLVNHTGEVSTSTTTYATALDAGTIDVATTSNVVVYYTAEGSLTDPNDILRLRCTIGSDSDVAQISDIKFVDYSNVNVTTSAVFYLPKSAGSYPVKIWFRSSNGNTVKLRNQTLTAVAYPTSLSVAASSTGDNKRGSTTYADALNAGTLTVSSGDDILIYYSAEGNTTVPGEVLHVRCLADSSEAKLSDIKLVDYATQNITRSTVFYNETSLPAGSYTIKAQFRSSTGDGVTLRNQTLIAVSCPDANLVANSYGGYVSTDNTTYDPNDVWNAGTLTTDTTSDVIVYYTAEGNLANTDDILRIQCKIGDNVASISDIKFVDAYSTNITTSAVFYSADLPPGSYPIKVGYRSSNGNEVTLRNQTLVAVARKAAPPPPAPVPEFSPVGLLAFIAIVSAVLAVVTMKKKREQ
ncbi:MAG: hypothetical protein ACXQTW_02025 [Candidatus Methanospirareceae archaeon]